MKKILALLSLILIAVLLIGCQPTPSSTDSAEEQTLDEELAEIESLEDDLDLTELDDLDQELAGLE